MGASCLQLKLLSLQGDKTACTIHQLQFQQQEQPAHHAPAAAVEVCQSTSSTSGLQQEQQHEQQQLPGADAAPQLTAAAAAASASPGQQPSLSQLEELRLLIQQLHTPGTLRARDTRVPVATASERICLWRRLAVVCVPPHTTCSPAVPHAQQAGQTVVSVQGSPLPGGTTIALCL